MALSRRFHLLFIALCFAAGAAFAASGPRITLRLTDATLLDACTALERAAGVQIDTTYAVGTVSAGKPAPRANLSWENATLDHALRELCARFQCICISMPDGYRLLAAGTPRRTQFFTETGGIRVAVTGVVCSERRTSAGLPNNRRKAPMNLSLTVAMLVDLDDARGDWNARFFNVVAQDDRGNRLTEQHTGPKLESTFPRQRSGHLRLNNVDPKASKLSWLQANLELWRQGVRSRTELPYPKPGGLEQTRVEAGFALEASQPRTTARTPAEDYPEGPPGPLSHPTFEMEQGPSILVRSLVTHAEGELGNHDSVPTPRAVGRSGKIYTGRSSVGSASNRNGQSLAKTVVFFPEAREPLEKLVWEFMEPKVIARPIQIRIQNIPFPPAGDLTVQQWHPIDGRLLNPREPTPPGNGASILKSLVRLHGRPAFEGVLRVGLASRAGTQWSPAQWSDLPVGASGTAELARVPPGTYRVMRQFVLTDPAFRLSRRNEIEGLATGRWLNSVVEVQVPDRGTVDLPPLEFKQEAELARQPPAGTALVESDAGNLGKKMDLSTVQLQLERSVAWEGWTGLYSMERREVSISYRPGPGEAAKPVGLLYPRNLSAVDDRGTILTASTSEASFGNRSGSQFVRFPGMHPGAKKLARVEGQLFGYVRKRRIRIETPFPQPGRSLLARDGDNFVVTAADDTLPRLSTAEMPMKQRLLPEDAEPPAVAPKIRFRVCYRDGVIQPETERMDAPGAPDAIGKSGTRYRPRGGGGMSDTVDGWTLQAHRATYPEAKEPLTKLVWELDYWDTAEELGYFRMHNIPLPPRLDSQVINSAIVPDVQRSRIRFRVLEGASTAVERRVHVGISRQSGAAWGPLRWREVRTDTSGITELDGIAPGRYRVWLSSAATGVPSGPRHAPVEITVVAGRTTELPAMRLPGAPKPK